LWSVRLSVQDTALSRLKDGFDSHTDYQHAGSKFVVRPFQIIFNPTSAAELSNMPKELQLSILGEFRGLPKEVMSTAMEKFGKLEREGHILHRFRIGDYRIYFEKHELGVVVHRILNRHTLKDFLYRSSLPVAEDQALQDNPKFWELICESNTRPNE
jgi:mRNA-degrading endonuclease RelE of RelBE toxin-antitoxin system